MSKNKSFEFLKYKSHQISHSNLASFITPNMNKIIKYKPPCILCRSNCEQVCFSKFSHSDDSYMIVYSICKSCLNDKDHEGKMLKFVKTKLFH